ncbi:MAG: sulfite exporter TauE/SafE family protein [Clostridia bacterium]|nr:sulfite exporter TauE/SafE family protein [Clostridia bacterium]
MKTQSKEKISVFWGGLLTGAVNGLLGAGGGMLAVPILKKQGLKTKQAHASSVAVILPLSAFSAAMYLINGKVGFSDAYAFMPWGLLGAAVGTFLLKKLSNKWLTATFSALMVWAGIRLWMK